MLKKGSFLDLTDDSKARMGGTTDVKMRFCVEPSNASLKEKVDKVGSTSFSRCIRHAIKFVSASGSAV